MGKGDKKSKKGKRFQHSFGKTRLRKKGLTISSRKKVAEKPKPVEHKKPFKAEQEIVKPTIVFEPKAEEVKIKEPKVTEIKEEVKIPEVKEEPVSKIPEIKEEPVKEEPKTLEPVVTKIKEEAISEVPKIAKEEVKEESKSEVAEKKSPKSKTKETTSAAPKKRGRPKKKKEE